MHRLRKFWAPLAALMLLFTSFLALTPAYAQDSAGLSIFSDFFSMENEQTFDERRAEYAAKIGEQECMSCQIFDQFAGAVFGVSSQVDGAGPGLIPVLTGFGSVFALFYLGSAFVSGDASDLLGRWQVFWRLCMAVAAGSVFLSAPLTNSWNYIFSPLFSIGEGVVNMVGGSSGGCGGNVSASAPAGAVAALQSMSRTVCGAYEMSEGGLATGLALMTQKDGFFNTIVFVVFGILVTAMYGFLMLTFPLRFIDVVIRLAIVGMITPILTLCAVFKPTRGYVQIAISNVLNATAQFAILSVMFKIGETVMKKMIADMGNLSVPNGEGGGDFGDAFFSGLVLFGIAFVFANMVRAVPAIAAEFSRHSGGGSDIGGNAAVGALGSTAATGAAAAGVIGGGGYKLIKAGAGRVAGSAGRSGKERLGKDVSS